MEKKRVVLAIGGSSGSIYAKLLLDKLLTREDVELSVVMSSNAKINWQLEMGKFDPNQYGKELKLYENNDFFAPFASGSAQFHTMIICPCSMGLIGRISNGISNDLISRAADVILKERRKLIIVPRETPYNLIHLRNMTALTESGAIICPASPSFYSKAKTIDQVVMTVVDRILDLAEIEIENSFRWGE